MKRVLCLLSCMNTGGAETFLMKVYRCLDKSMYQMDFGLGDVETCFYRNEIEKMGGKIYYVTPKTKDLANYKKELYKLVKENQYEHVLRISSNGMGFMDLKIAKKAGAKRCIVRSSNSSDGSSFKSKIAHRLGRLLYSKYIDVKIAPSDLAAEYTFGKRAYRNGIVQILHNGVDTDVYKFSEAERTQIRNELGVSDSEFVIGHVGRFDQQKNHKFLIEIFAEILKLKENSVLMLVGKGELENKIKEQIANLGIEDKVIFTGVRSDIPALLSAMDVFVMPSFYEGMPNTVIEAQATGLPCVISDTITQEANITGLVEYLPLTKAAGEWAVKSLPLINEKRIDTKQHFVDNKYDIESVVDKFIRLVFEDK